MNPIDDIGFLQKIAQGCTEVSRIPGIEYHYNKRTLVFQNNKVKLYHYKSIVKRKQSIPTLVVFATVNRPEILDLFPDRSFIRGLLNNGVDVYLLDWGYPDLNDKALSFTDYVSNYLHHCVEFIKESKSLPQINLLGICQGGVICSCYAALSESIKNLVLISTPIDFQTSDNVISQVFRTFDVHSFVDIAGNISGLWLTQFFISLRPYELVGKKYLKFVDNIEDKNKTDNFLQVEKWLYDAPDQTGASFIELVEGLYQNNKLIKNEFTVSGEHVNLADLNMPILNVLANEDEIVPVSASIELKKYITSQDYSEAVFPSGHIGIYISEKVGKNMSSSIASWLKQRI